MILLLHRFALLQSLMIWQGGFLFYALVVVPIGGEVLGSEIEQGFITRRVTLWMNACGAACLALVAVDLKVHRQYQKVRSILFAISALLLLLLTVSHRHIDGYLDPVNHIIQDRGEFYRWHAGYLILSGLQWLVMLAVAGLMLSAWRAHDAAIRCRDTKPETP